MGGHVVHPARGFSLRGSEMDSFSASANEVRAAGNLGDKPLNVLTAAKVVPAPPGLPQKEFDDIQNNWGNNLQSAKLIFPREAVRSSCMTEPHGSLRVRMRWCR
jgi:hypothetical protein